MMIKEQSEKRRQETVCQGCNRHKSLGLEVCWDCFKYCQDIKPLKYYSGSTEAWIEYARKERGLI